MYVELEEFKHHLQDEHADLKDDESSLARFTKASESVQDVADRACPICTVTLDTNRGMEIHIALHLERFALFSLPRSAVDDDESESNAESDKAHGVVEEESSEGGFSDSPESSSEGPIEADDIDPENRAGFPANAMALTESAIEPLQELFHPFNSMDNTSKALRVQGKYDVEIENEEMSHTWDSKSNEENQEE